MSTVSRGFRGLQITGVGVLFDKTMPNKKIRFQAMTLGRRFAPLVGTVGVKVRYRMDPQR